MGECTQVLCHGDPFKLSRQCPYPSEPTGAHELNTWDPVGARVLSSWVPMEAHGFPWALMGSDVFPWGSMAKDTRAHGNPGVGARVPMGDHFMGLIRWTSWEPSCPNMRCHDKSMDVVPWDPMSFISWVPKGKDMGCP